MAAQSNGRAKKPKKSPASGTINGQANGTADKSSLSKSTARTSNRNRKRRGIMASLTSIIGRLISWYIIITVFFRCPSSLTHISDASPAICKPYLHARSYAAPYLDPYYQTYVAPQVEKVKPYTDRFESQVYTPVAEFTKDKYATYGAHRVDQAQQYAEAEWDRTVRPQLHNAQEQAVNQYRIYLAPHVKTASDAASPYYEQTKASLDEIYHLTLLPTYEAVLPYSRQAYAHGHHIVTHIIFPNVLFARDATWSFVTRTLWPQMRLLYGDNVEPQLVRIQERLGRYRDQQKMESAADAIESEMLTDSDSSEPTTSVPDTSGASTAPSSSSSSTASSSSSKGGWNVLDDFFGADSSSTTETTEVQTKTSTKPKESKLTRAELKEKLDNDLREWQMKFATAADKGAEDLEQRVADITKRQVENSVNGQGVALVVQLEETAESTVTDFKNFIKDTVKSIPENAKEEDLEAAYEQCVGKTREFGLSVKEKAQNIRTWKANYDQQTDDLVRAAIRSTVEVLEKIHGLGLQEVGMRWAWTDGVTYKDWQKYHKLRSTLNEWQAEVEAVGSKHEGLRVAHEEAKKLEDQAMDASAKMVSELVRLKDVSRWKIWAEDATDDFSQKEVLPRTYKAAQEVMEDGEEAASQVSEAVLGSETPVSGDVASSIEQSVSDTSSKLSESVDDSDVPSAQTAASDLKSSASEASSDVSEAVSSASSDAESIPSEASQSVESVIKAGEETAQQAASQASEAPKKVFGGAMAQVLAEAREVVFDEPLVDDEETYSEKVQDMVAEAGDHAADVSRAVSEALLGPSKTQGNVESATSLASEQYQRAMAAASGVLYGTEQQPMESATSVAAERFAQAVAEASYAIYGTPTPTAFVRTAQAQASSRYSDAVSMANERLTSAKSQFSELVSGTPQPAHETMLSMMENAYSDSLAAASERLHAALHYTDSVKSYAAGPTQGYFESVSSIAAARLSEGLDHASSQFSAQPTPAVAGGRRQYYEAIGLAHARYSEFLGSASTALYGPQQGTAESLASVASASAASVAAGVSGSAQSVAENAEEVAESLASQASSSFIGSETAWTESMASQASQNWESLIAKASEQVYGAPTPWSESIYSQVGEYGAHATAQAAEQYTAIQALVSELVVGKEPDFTESVMNRLQSAYYTGLPAAVSSASSYAEGGYEAASEYVEDAYASASSVVSSIFTPPPAIETILSEANEQLNAAVESASIAVYGTSKGNVEQASESVASAYSAAQSQASDYIYGTQQAQDSFQAVTASAQAAISQAIYGTPTAEGYVAEATEGAESVYNSVSSVASEKAEQAASAVSSAVSSAMYGPEQGAVESASSRLAAAVEAANSRISDMYADAAQNAEDAASSVSSVVTEATQRVRDEL